LQEENVNLYYANQLTSHLVHIDIITKLVRGIVEFSLVRQRELWKELAAKQKEPTA